MKVTFNDLDEFLDELQREFAKEPAIPGEILRVTFAHRASPQLPISTLSVEAGFVNGLGDLVTFGHRVGEQVAGDPHAQRISQKGQEILTRIEGAARTAGLEVRRGLYSLE